MTEPTIDLDALEETVQTYVEACRSNVYTATCQDKLRRYPYEVSPRRVLALLARLRRAEAERDAWRELAEAQSAIDYADMEAGHMSISMASLSQIERKRRAWERVTELGCAAQEAADADC